jgi:hypothetical protein
MLYCDDGDDMVLELRKWRARDNLSPPPPRGWLIVTTFDGPSDPREIGCWLYILSTAQQASKQSGSRLHALARDEAGKRVLVAHPALGDELTDAVGTVNEAVQHCSCGGECIEPDLQKAAARVLARRRWMALPTSERIDYLLSAETDADIGLAFADIDEIIVLGHADVMDEIAYHG